MCRRFRTGCLVVLALAAWGGAPAGAQDIDEKVAVAELMADLEQMDNAWRLGEARLDRLGRRLVLLAELPGDEIPPRGGDSDALRSWVEGAAQRALRRWEARETPGTLTERNDWIVLHGILETEWVHTGMEKRSPADATRDEDPHLQLDRFTLAPTVLLRPGLRVEGEAEFRRDRVLARRGVLAWDAAGPALEFRVGLEDRFIAESPEDRATESYPLAGEAFWGEEAQTTGIRAGGAWGWLRWRAAATNSLRLERGGLGKDETFGVLRDERDGAGPRALTEVGVGLGVEGETERFGRISAMGFGIFDGLEREEMEVLHGIDGYGFSEDDRQDRFGARAAWEWGGFRVAGQWWRARDGKLDRTVWYVQPSYRYSFGEDRDWFRAVTAIFRYDAYDVNLEAVPTDALTWDRTAYVPGVAIDLHRRLRLLAELAIRGESTGSKDVRNDELVLQLRWDF